MTKTYHVNEIFYSLQGEGRRAGEPSIFVRFAGCNLACRMEEAADSPGGFDCDTTFDGGQAFTLEELCTVVSNVARASCDESDLEDLGCAWIVLTGGEPALQVDPDLIESLHDLSFKVAIETNGTKALPKGIDWITVSPKTADHTIKVKEADEVKFVRAPHQALPKTSIVADHRYLSPAAGPDGVYADALKWCIGLVLENPDWSLSVQQHKQWRLR